MSFIPHYVNLSNGNCVPKGDINFETLSYNRTKNDIGIAEVRFNTRLNPFQLEYGDSIRINREYADGVIRPIDEQCWFLADWRVSWDGCDYIVDATFVDTIGWLARLANSYPPPLLANTLANYPSNIIGTPAEIILHLLYFAGGGTNNNFGGEEVAEAVTYTPPPGSVLGGWGGNENAIYITQIIDAYGGNILRRNKPLIIPLANTGTGDLVQIQEPWSNDLSNILINLTETSLGNGVNLWIDLECNPDGSLVFQFFEGCRGQDLTSTHILSPELGNFQNAELTYDYSEWADIAILVGPESDVTGLNQTSVAFNQGSLGYNTKYGPVERIFTSDLDRDAAGTIQQVFLDREAERYLAEAQRVVSITGDILPLEPFRLFDDVNLGDKIRVEMFSQKFNIEISGYTVDIDSTGVDATLEYEVSETVI